MKLQIGRYAVDVMAQTDGKDKTSVFLNEIMPKCFRAADVDFTDGFPVLARESVGMGRDIYSALDGIGFYDAVK